MPKLYQLTFYVPPTHLETVKDAIFNAGAGHYNGYDRCAWQSLGRGQFRALPGSKPYRGDIYRLEFVEEVKVETLIEEHNVRKVLNAMLEAHPYEQPAYAVTCLLSIEDFH
jgi:structural hemagglutinin/hemolysin toxin protein RtxA